MDLHYACHHAHFYIHLFCFKKVTCVCTAIYISHIQEKEANKATPKQKKTVTSKKRKILSDSENVQVTIPNFVSYNFQLHRLLTTIKNIYPKLQLTKDLYDI